MTPDRAQLLEAVAQKLCARRQEDPKGRTAVLKGNKVVTTGTFLDQAREDVRTVLDAAIPGFLDGKVDIPSSKPEDPIPF